MAVDLNPPTYIKVALPKVLAWFESWRNISLERTSVASSARTVTRLAHFEVNIHRSSRFHPLCHKIYCLDFIARLDVVCSQYA